MELIIYKIVFYEKFGKDVARKMMKTRLTNLENLGYEIKIYQKDGNDNLVIKLRNQETKKPRN